MELDLYQKVKSQIQSLLGINLDYYKDEQMRRRLDSWLARSGEPNWEAYFARVKIDSNELARLRDYITINVTEFFRDQERWAYLRQNVIPELLTDSLKIRTLGNGIRIWSAGCSIGAEPYSLAIMLDEIAKARFHTIVATDLDRGALAKAKAGGPYLTEEIKNVTPAQRAAYFKPGGPPYFINPELTKKITFREHNLITDTSEGDFDLIVCRNVVIYFTGETKDKLYKKFQAALRPGGILFVGGTEIIPHPQEIGLKGFGFSFYKKV
jgi:chemotaxis protein methyltransferase CheR